MACSNESATHHSNPSAYPLSPQRPRPVFAPPRNPPLHHHRPLSACARRPVHLPWDGLLVYSALPCGWREPRPHRRQLWPPCGRRRLLTWPRHSPQVVLSPLTRSSPPLPLNPLCFIHYSSLPCSTRGNSSLPHAWFGGDRCRPLHYPITRLHLMCTPTRRSPGCSAVGMFLLCDAITVAAALAREACAVQCRAGAGGPHAGREEIAVVVACRDEPGTLQVFTYSTATGTLVAMPDCGTALCVGWRDLPLPARSPRIPLITLVYTSASANWEGGGQ